MLYIVTGYVKNALEKWLPPQDKFDEFASEIGLSGTSGKPSHSVTNDSGAKSKHTRYCIVLLSLEGIKL